MSLDQLFRTARTRNSWTAQPVSDGQIVKLYQLTSMGPTSANSCPARFIWVKSAGAKARLAALAMPANQPKILAAPVTVIIGYDLDFAEKLPRLFPARGHQLKAMFDNDLNLAQTTAFRNGSLQGAYLIVAARALGLDCGPMSGFDNLAVDKEFFPQTRIHSNFLCCVGYGSDQGLFPRNPRLSFEETCSFV
jgi:3-hydroxypropanoate dehydrogenase